MRRGCAGGKGGCRGGGAGSMLAGAGPVGAEALKLKAFEEPKDALKDANDGNELQGLAAPPSPLQLNYQPQKAAKVHSIPEGDEMEELPPSNVVR